VPASPGGWQRLRTAATPKGRLADRPYLPAPLACSTALLMAAVTTEPMP
jgi:hypothetical protein